MTTTSASPPPWDALRGTIAAVDAVVFPAGDEDLPPAIGGVEGDAAAAAPPTLVGLEDSPTTILI